MADKSSMNPKGLSIGNNVNDNENEQQKGREAKFSPVFLSPGGNFHKAKKPTLPLSPDANLCAHTMDAAISGIADLSIAPEENHNDGDGSVFEKILAENVESAATVGRGALPKASHIDTGEEDSALHDGVSWGIRKGDHNLLGLFGGAITMELPASFEDISAIRQVPDHQEVFMDKATDISFIVELLGGDSSVPDAEAAAYYFQDLAECNEATNATISEQRVLPNGVVMLSLKEVEHRNCALSGIQVARNSRSASAPLDTVYVLMVVLRLPSVGTDCLLSVNIPQKESTLTSPPTISSFCKADTTAPADENAGVKALRMAVQSFNIVDWSLF